MQRIKQGTEISKCEISAKERPLVKLLQTNQTPLQIKQMQNQCPPKLSTSDYPNANAITEKVMHLVTSFLK
jgi:hypothetical protein